MVIRDKNEVAAVLKWGNKWYEPITPTGYMTWITDNPSELPNIRLRPKYMLVLGLW